MLVETNEKVVAFVTPTELRVIDQIRKGRTTAKDISKHSGIILTWVRTLLCDLVAVEYIVKNKNHVYRLLPNVEFRPNVERAEPLVAEKKPIPTKPIAPTFVQKRLPKHDPKLVEYTLPPDELEKLRKESFKHVRYFQTKDGGYIINADYHRG